MDNLFNTITKCESKVFVKRDKYNFKDLLLSNLDFTTNHYSPRHHWHAFPAKFPPELPRFFIEHLVEPGQTVLDPMSGSCTTLIESSILNRNSIGFDIDPLSLIIGKAKLSNINIQKTLQISNSVINKAYKEFTTKDIQLYKEMLTEFDNETLEFIDYWFRRDTQLELFSLMKQIRNIEDETIRSLLSLVFSSIIITKSGGVTLALDLAHTRPHKVPTKKTNSAIIEFKKKSNKILSNGNSNLEGVAKLYEGNAKSLSLPNDCVDLIVTSPPYANNAIDYMRAHKFSLVWFGYSINRLKSKRKQFIGSEDIQNFNFISLPEFSNKKIIELSKVNPKKGLALHRYFTEMYLSIN